MHNSGKLAGKTVFITGASRGIGKAIALRAAKDKANVVIAAKSATPNPKLEGTIFSAAEEVEAAGGRCLPLQVDVREEAQVQSAVEEAVKKFGGIDILVNNASAISLTSTLDTPMKRFDLMQQINARGTFLTSKLCIPYLKKSKNPHILNLSPPLSLRPVWFGNHVAYTMAKYGMSMCVIGMAEEFKDDGIAVNGLWPRTAIWTAAMNMLGGDEAAKSCRKPEICADAFYAVVTRNSREYTGHIVLDEHILRESGVSNFDGYAMEKGDRLLLDGFIDDDIGKDVLPAHSGIRNRSGRSAENSGNVEKSATETDSVAVVFSEVEMVLKAQPDVKLDGVYVFDIDGEKWFLDGKKRTVSQENVQADPLCTMIMKKDTFMAVFTGRSDATMAVMSGKIKVKGNLAAAMKLDKLFSKFLERTK
ncbi:hydroxysteroid dehydrogenase-like protein 2 [Paramacrobiotus metropolitanus]|uniref:hydroxysteroid dehydrogenase-like protein 2 n=1 Tax=Paramacrobiotus metropolitanus TaxID=2943436 RepID=UPI002445CCA3|nr:hydroxysteroid dehydrogenase-like protein 2 [Paramacrobiotus metropolitanus]